jgi:hypothetical protein
MKQIISQSLLLLLLFFFFINKILIYTFQKCKDMHFIFIYFVKIFYLKKNFQ